MAGSVNKVILVGNLGADPEIRRLNSGDSVVNMRIATSETWRDKSSGERKEKTEWHSVAIFNEGLANVAEKYLRKGSKVYIEGALQTRKWQDAQGQDKYSTEIVLQGFNSVLTMLDGGRWETSVYGNLLSCTAFLYGLAAEELRPDELHVADPEFPLIVAARVVKDHGP